VNLTPTPFGALGGFRFYGLLFLMIAMSVAGAEKLEPIDKGWFEEHYTKFEHRIAMRDGVRLMTAVYAPKDSRTNYPFLLTRTPYSVKPYGADSYQDPKGLVKYFGRDGFIFVLQDVRGRYGSEGEFVHVRPIRPEQSGPLDTDESTDVWDTIDWLLKNVSHHNGRVGLCGISYPGFYSSCGAIDSHPALKLVSPQAPIGDWFVGDDFRHNGCLYLPHAFGFLSSFEQKLEKPTRDSAKPFDYETPDGYEFYLHLGPLANAEERYFKGKVPFWNELNRHDTYDEFWKTRNIAPRLKNIRAAVLTVGGWYDAEDLYGTFSTYQSIENQNPGIFNALVIGPWAHGQWHTSDGDKLGYLNFRSKTAEYFRQEIELPFFRDVLKGAGAPKLPEISVFETGTCEWKQYTNWPPSQAVERSLFLGPEGSLGFTPPNAASAGYDEYVSDPAKPVPFIPNIAVSMTREHMLDDQRFASSRPDVLVYRTPPLEDDITVVGPIQVTLHVSTSGTDSDWIVKLIDVYPGDFPNPDPNPEGVQLGGYQQLVRGEPMRGKFRESFERPKPFEPGQVTSVAWTLPDVSHSFRRGHRIMVHIQSSWFPLVDRNPQKFCTIAEATAGDFIRATQRVFHKEGSLSSLRLRVLAR
jgi:uncharacterized protein